MDSTFYVNGEVVGEWKYGYSTFEHDITNFLKEGENEILLKVVYQGPNSRWYSGAGIYRNVWLKTRGENHLESNGIYISTKQLDHTWQVDIESDIIITENATLRHELFRKEEKVTESEASLNSSEKNQQLLEVENPELWSPESPSLYQLKTTLLNQAGEVIEEVIQNVGFRTFTLDSNEGLLINGKKTQINGVCEHHDLGALGASFNPVALERRMKRSEERRVGK